MLIFGNHFRFSAENNIQFDVIHLSRSMHFYPSRNYITGNKLYFEYNARDIQKMFKLFDARDCEYYDFLP